MTYLGISELATRAAVPASALRYYERVGFGGSCVALTVTGPDEAQPLIAELIGGAGDAESQR
jgi:hypothetical protein